ncbi:IPT/TIG domain-containing protein [Vulgatibacter incomptus]|uniref:IPT/TIG domain-containing protein n=1 Tax=Vulgatibacter incomptus TaxID=1391653 RepID=A0A0K1PHQ0_9BACT|nr:IPT/TIG domain-containing protein [Vulgatibacter incomptus]AKU93068.1 hypothetical protein AKJ08_3455 [Vulgatibacter incomptus]
MGKLSRIAALSIALAGLVAVGCGVEPPKSGGTGGSSGSGKPHGRAGDGGDTETGGDGGGDPGTGGTGGGGGIEPGGVRLDAVRPPRGSMGGGETLILRGAGFLPKEDSPGGPTTVFFGTNPAIGARVVNDTTIYVAAPPGTLGDVDVSLQNVNGEASCVSCYRYLEPVDLRAVEPAEGPTTGGSAVILRGSGLRADMTILFGGRAALDVTSLDDGSLSAILPPGDAEGPVDVRVFSEDGQAWLRKAFTYVARLRIDRVDPPGGPLAGGNRVMLSGAGFTASSRVYFGDTPAATTLGPAGSLSATVPPAAAAGAVEISVRTHASTARATYAYFDPADTTVHLYAISPDRGAVSGGTTVTLVGTGLDSGQLAVRFGGVLAVPAAADGGNFVTATSPGVSAAGLVDVEVRVATGNDTLASAYRYLTPIGVTSVSPSDGPTAGGTAITVLGAGFPDRVRVFVGALEATNVVRVSGSQITATTPRGTDGSVPVRVVAADDDGVEGILVGGFRYDGPFSLALVDPSMGARAGGTRVTLRGSGFRPGMATSFGDTASPSVQVIDPFTAVATTPKGSTGVVDVQASRSDGASALISGAFTYFDPTSTTGGSSGGPINGNLNVTALDGSRENFGMPLEGARVLLGSDDGSLQGITDERGQVTISSSLLVKAQQVTVSMPGYEMATVVKQQSENLTVLLQPLGGGGGPGGPSEGPPPGTVRGRVFGFKLPPNRKLKPSEREMAFVHYAPSSVYFAPPWVDDDNYKATGKTINVEGGEFSYMFGNPGRMAFYAEYGIQDADGSFERLLLGVARGVEVRSGKTVQADIVLDMRLDMSVPVTIENPPRIGSWSGTSNLWAFVDLGPEGVVPVGNTRDSSGNGSTTLTKLPWLTGDSFLFEVFGGTDADPNPRRSRPLTVAFRRQPGDLTAGLTVGPLMGLPSVAQRGDGPITSGGGSVIEWTYEPGPDPEIAYLEISAGISVWHIVLPGTERQVQLPASVLDELRTMFPRGTELDMQLISGREPRFTFDQWGYSDTWVQNYTSFSLAVGSFFL